MIKFINYDTKKEFELKLDKELIFVFGGNGTGKTTLSREFKSDDSFVFNTDFINRNVYVTAPKGIKIDSEIKENFSSLFLGEEAVSLAKTVEKIENEVKKLKGEFERKENGLKNEISNLKLSNYSDFGEINNSVEFEFVFSHEKSKEENKSSFKYKKGLGTFIRNKEEFEKHLIIYNEQTIINGFNEKVLNDKTLTSVIKYKKVEFNYDRIEEYNRKVSQINEIEKSFKTKDGIKDIQSWVKLGVELHNYGDDCYFCGNKNIDESIKMWKAKLENELIKNKRLLLEDIEKFLNSIKDIANDNIYEKVLPKTISTLKNFSKEFKQYKVSLEQNKPISIVKTDIIIDESSFEQSELNKNLVNYYLNNNNLEELIFEYVYINDYEKYLNKSKEKSIKKNAEYAEKTASIINKISDELGFAKNIKVVSDNRGNMPKVSLSDGETKISEFSEGQRHKLALSIFIASLFNTVKPIKNIVLDDPVNTLDVKSYFSLKRILLHKLPTYKHLIILTHNFSYLNVQASNILNNEKLLDKSKLMEITPDEFREISFKAINYDDILLLATVLKETKTLADISKYYWMILKVARNYLDLRLRIQGADNYGNPTEEINSLNISSQLKSELSSYLEVITKNCNRIDIKVSQLRELFENFDSFIKKLEFPKFTLENIYNILNKHNENEKLEQSEEIKDIFEEVLLFGKNIFFHDEEKTVETE
ncbi:MAG TPA: AAA family ATPase, partial [Acholeplasma sp.]|nr:AAA family ATPase [Acholeplasma sp.]